ncbi:MAG: TlyA family RNA methyltransferase [Coriobacteriales bacterium]|nr:TlyA family RNA methyltransferase [Coriobacteriales bacterium]
MSNKTIKIRLDEELVEQGYFLTTEDALRAIMEGRVSSHGERLTQAGKQVPHGIDIHVKGTKTSEIGYVGRGGLKLAGALKNFCIDVNGKRCLDAGCSTGGFTDCLLKHGASHVVAIDVGYGQFDWSLRNDNRISLFERTNICNVTPQDIGGACDLIVADVSFTSIEHIAEALVLLMNNKAELCSLVKPQFEANSHEVEEGGIVRDINVHKRVLMDVVKTCDANGLCVQDVCVSPITGAKGNREYFVYAIKSLQSHTSPDINTKIERICGIGTV